MNVDNLDLAEELIYETLDEKDSMSAAILHFFRCVTVCNSLIPIVNKNVVSEYVTVYPEEEVML